MAVQSIYNETFLQGLHRGNNNKESSSSKSIKKKSVYVKQGKASCSLKSEATYIHINKSNIFNLHENELYHRTELLCGGYVPRQLQFFSCHKVINP